MSTSAVKVSYYDPFGIFSSLSSEFQLRLPLQSLQIRLPQRPLHIVSHLDLSLVPYHLDSKATSPSAMLKEPLLHLFLVTLTNLDVYRQVIKNHIQEWLITIKNRKESDWLIVLVYDQDKVGLTGLETGSGLSNGISNGSVLLLDGKQKKGHSSGLSASNLISSFKSATTSTATMTNQLLEKLRQHFKDGSKRERVLPIRSSSKGCTDFNLFEIQWQEFIDTVKDSISESFNNSFGSFQDEVNKLDFQRRFPGWNFCPFFVKKLSLAVGLKTIHQFRDSLKLLDELEVCFLQASPDTLTSWFPDLTYTSSEILNTKLQLTQNDDEDDLAFQKIATNGMRLFEFKVYLFTKQVQLLLEHLDAPVEAGGRAIKFILNFASSIEQHMGESLITDCVVALWVYRTTSDLFQAIDDYAEQSQNFHQNHRKPNSSNHVDRSLVTVRASLLNLATVQLDKLGILYNRLPLQHPFSLAFTLPKLKQLHLRESDPNAYPTLDLTGLPLQLELEDDDRFDSLYLSNTTKLKAEYESGYRTRSLASCQLQVAALHAARSRWLYVVSELEVGLETYLQEGWTQLVMPILPKLIFGLEYLKRYVDLIKLGLRLLVMATLPSEFALELKDTLVKSTRQLEQVELVRKAKLFVTLVEVNRKLNSESIAIQIGLNSNFFTVLPIDSIEVELSGGNNSTITLKTQSKDLQLQPNSNLFSLYAEEVTLGKYTVDSFTIRLGDLKLRQSFEFERKLVYLEDYSNLPKVEAKLFTDGLQIEVSSQSNHLLEGSLILEDFNQIGSCSSTSSSTTTGFVLSEVDSKYLRKVDVPTKVLSPNQLRLLYPSLLPNSQVLMKVELKVEVGIDLHILLPCTVSFRTTTDSLVRFKVLLKVFLLRDPFHLSWEYIPKLSGGEAYLKVDLKLNPKSTPTHIFNLQLQPDTKELEGGEVSLGGEDELRNDDLAQHKPNEPWFAPMQFTATDLPLLLLPNHTLTFLFDDVNEVTLSHPKPTRLRVKVQHLSIKQKVEVAVGKILDAKLMEGNLANRFKPILTSAIIPYLDDVNLLLDLATRRKIFLPDFDSRDFQFAMVNDPLVYTQLVNLLEGFFEEYKTLDLDFVNGQVERSNGHHRTTTFLPVDLDAYQDTISVDYQLDEGSSNLQLGQVYSLQFTLKLECRNQVDRRVRLKCSLDLTCGQSLQLWAVTGKVQQIVDLELGEVVQLRFTITPTVLGAIPLPHLQLFHEAEMNSTRSTNPNSTPTTTSPTFLQVQPKPPKFLSGATKLRPNLQPIFTGTQNFSLPEQQGLEEAVAKFSLIYPMKDNLVFIHPILHSKPEVVQLEDNFDSLSEAIKAELLKEMSILNQHVKSPSLNSNNGLEVLRLGE